MGAVLGPFLVGPAGEAARRLGHDELSGPARGELAAVPRGRADCCSLRLRPEPRELAIRSGRGQGHGWCGRLGCAAPLAEILRSPRRGWRSWRSCSGHAVMVMLMVITSVHMNDHHHPLVQHRARDLLARLRHVRVLGVLRPARRRLGTPARHRDRAVALAVACLLGAALAERAAARGRAVPARPRLELLLRGGLGTARRPVAAVGARDHPGLQRLPDRRWPPRGRSRAAWCSTRSATRSWRWLAAAVSLVPLVLLRPRAKS